MDAVVDSVARWIGILSTGMLIGSEAEESAMRARRVLGGERLGELRRYMDELPIEAARDTKIAMIEACITIVHADREVSASERELLERIVQLAELDEGASAWLLERIDAPRPLDAVTPRIGHPALRELVLVIAWQLALADGKVAREEHGAYGMLADALGIAPARASELRTLLREA